MGKASDKLYELADRPDASEHAIQAAYFAWTTLYARETGDPRIQFICAVPNGGARDMVTGGILKAEGVKPGVPDVFLPFWSGRHPFGMLEFKRPRHRGEENGGLSEYQVEYRDHLIGQGVFYRVVYSWGEARDATLEYLKASR